MEEGGKEVTPVVPPGAGNPLGKYALKTSLPGIMIHSTNLPASVYGFSSHGCIRILPEEMENFFKQVRLRTPGEIIYQPVKVAVADNGRVFLEVHRDIYGKINDLEQEAKMLLEKSQVTDRVAWEKVRKLVKMKSGIPEDVTL